MPTEPRKPSRPSKRFSELIAPKSQKIVNGTATSADVVAVATQGVAAGELADVIRAMRRGDAYVNVHTTTYPGGEIRGPVQ